MEATPGNERKTGWKCRTRENKNSIDVGTVAELLPVLATVKKCVEAGELDAQIDAASAAVRARFTK